MTKILKLFAEITSRVGGLVRDDQLIS